MGQAKKVGSKASWKNIKKVLKTGIETAGKTAKFIPALNLLMNLTSKSATATQPGTGTHGGTKTGTYNPKTNKYE